MVRPVASPSTKSGLARKRAAINPAARSAARSASGRMITSIASASCRAQKQLAQIVLARERSAPVQSLFELAIGPMAQPVKRGEGEPWRRSTLTTDQLGPTAHIVHHPGRQAQMIGVPRDLAYV